jgi:hypothetical protein
MSFTTAGQASASTQMFTGRILGAERGLDPVPVGEAGSHLLSRVHRMSTNRWPGIAALGTGAVACCLGGMLERCGV